MKSKFLVDIFFKVDDIRTWYNPKPLKCEDKWNLWKSEGLVDTSIMQETDFLTVHGMSFPKNTSFNLILFLTNRLDPNFRGAANFWARLNWQINSNYNINFSLNLQVLHDGLSQKTPSCRKEMRFFNVMSLEHYPRFFLLVK